MALIDDFRPTPLPAFAGEVNYQDKTKVLPGCASKAQDVRFQTDHVGPRFGTIETMVRPLSQPAAATGVDVLEVLGELNPGEVPIVFCDNGSLFLETPAGAGPLVPLTPPLPLPPGARMLATKAENSMFMAFSDGKIGLRPPLMYNGRARTLFRAGQNTIGALWKGGLFYAVGDLVRSDDGRWWRAIVGSLVKTLPAQPSIPSGYGKFDGLGANPLQWVPLSWSAPDGSQWEEWTPACTNRLITPIQPTDFGILGGQGTLPGGKDIYIKFSYVNISTGETDLSPALVVPNVTQNDAIQLGKPQMQRWMAEILLQPSFFVGFGLNVYVAAVNNAAAAPADSAYKMALTNVSVGLLWSITSVPIADAATYTKGAFFTLSGPAAGGRFLGQAGKRWMMVVRKNRNRSLVSVDADSPLQVDLEGESKVNVVSTNLIATPISRATNILTVYVDDIRAFRIGQVFTVENAKNSTFNKSYTATDIGPHSGLAYPAGALAASDTGGNLTSEGGQVTTVGTTLPVAFIPPGGADDLQDIAAFTAVDGVRAGPFFYISEALPLKPFSTTILKFTVSNGAISADLLDASGLEAGNTCLVTIGNPANASGLVVIASVAGNKVTWATLSASDGNYTGGTLRLEQNLPTTAASGPSIATVTRDDAGNVQAALADVGGYAVGQCVIVSDAPAGSFSPLNGTRELVGITINSDGVSGVLKWLDVPFVPQTAANATISSAPIIANFQDELLADEVDNEVTDQLGMSPPPNAADVQFLPSINKFAYSTGIDSKFYFSLDGDPASIDSELGILSVDDNSMTRAICVRELRTGEIIAFKEDGGYALNPSSLPPKQWPCPKRWKEHGPPCAQAVATGATFAVFASFRSKLGAYRYDNGDLQWISEEYQGTWDRVNKSAIATIWSLVDEQEKEVQFGVPLDDATSPSHILVCSYLSGWEFPEQVSRSGTLFTARTCRKWSIRTIAAKTGNVVQRTLQPAQPALSDPWPFVSIRRTKGLVEAIYQDVSKIPPVLVPGGKVSVTVPGDHSFDGVWNADTFAFSPPTLAWYQGVIANLSIGAWSWSNGVTGNGAAMVEIAGAPPAGLLVGQTLLNVQLAGPSGVFFANSGVLILALVVGPTSYTISFNLGAVISPDSASGTGGSLVLYNAPPDVLDAGPGTSFMYAQVPDPPSDARIAKRQLVYGVSGPNPYQTYRIKSASRVNGVVTLIIDTFGLIGNTDVVIVGDADDSSFDGTFAVIVAAIEVDGVHVVYNQADVDATCFAGNFSTTLAQIRLTMQDPSRHNDSGVAIDEQYQSFFFRGRNNEVMRWAGVRGQALGAGNMTVMPVLDKSGDADLTQQAIDLTSDVRRQFTREWRIPDSHHVALLFTNGKGRDAWFELHEVKNYGNPLYGGERS